LCQTDLQSILFDAGGTLVRIDYAFIAEVARSHGHDVGDDDLLRGEVAARLAIDDRARAARRPEGTDATRVPGYFENVLRGARVPEGLIDRIRVEVESQHRESNLWRVALPGALETLRGLRSRGVRTAIVSNSDGRVRAKLARLGLTDDVEFVLDSHEEGVEKPDPAIFERALARMGVAAERAAYIGDIYSIDAIGARAAGLHPVLVDPTGAYDGIDCITIRTLSELLMGIDGRRS